jgi:hypothetical protein
MNEPLNELLYYIPGIAAPIVSFVSTFVSNPLFK